MSKLAASDISIMLSAPDKRYREASGILSRLYRILLINSGINRFRWDLLLNLYLDRISTEQEMTHDMISNEKSNLRKGLNDIDMTYPMFKRGIDMLAIHEAILYTELHWEDGTRVFVQVPVLGKVPDPSVGPLTYLFRMITGHLGKDYNNLNPEIDHYLSNPLVRVEIKGKKRGNDKGNLRRELTVDDMTWEVYKKGLRVLSPVRTEIGLKVKWNKRSKAVTHKLIINTPRV